MVNAAISIAVFLISLRENADGVSVVNEFVLTVNISTITSPGRECLVNTAISVAVFLISLRENADGVSDFNEFVLTVNISTIISPEPVCPSGKFPGEIHKF